MSYVLYNLSQAPRPAKVRQCCDTCISFLPRAPHIPHTYCAGSERRAACGWACAVVVLSLATTLLLVAISYLHRDLDTAMSGKDRGAHVSNVQPPAAMQPSSCGVAGRAVGYYKAIYKFVLVILVAAPLFALAGAPVMPHTEPLVVAAREQSYQLLCHTCSFEEHLLFHPVCKGNVRTQTSLRTASCWNGGAI